MEFFKNASDQSRSSSWQPWSTSTDDDAWEDVADIAQKPAADAVIIPPEGNPATSNRSSETSRSGEMTGTHMSPPTNLPLVNTKARTDVQTPLVTDTAVVVSLERKIIALTHERDALRRARDRPDDSTHVSALREEGERLSARLAERESAARTLKVSLREREAELADAQAAASALTAKLEASGSRVRALEAAERSAIDARAAAEKRVRSAEAESRARGSSSAALDAARAQLEAARRAHAQALEDAAMRAAADRDTAVEQVQAASRSREQVLQNTLAELRAHLAGVTERAGWREDTLRQEVDELRTRARDLEARNDELAAALPDATRPLLRQVEALQAAAGERVRARSAVDRSAADRLRAAESMAAAASEREIAAERRADAFNARVTGLEEALRLARSDAAQAAEELVSTRRELADVQERITRVGDAAEEKLRGLAAERDGLRAELRRERASTLDMNEATEAKERELRAALAASEARFELSRQQTHVDIQVKSELNHGQPSAVGTAQDNEGGIENGDPSADPGEGNGVYAQQRGWASARLRDGALKALQMQLESKEAATRALAEEVVALTGRLDAVALVRSEEEMSRERLMALEQRHKTLLELLGEREERISELEADIADVKIMYKEQVTELLLRIECLSE